MSVSRHGRLLATVLGTVGKRVLGKAFGKTVKAIEARNDAQRSPELTEDRSARSESAAAAA